MITVWQVERNNLVIKLTGAEWGLNPRCDGKG